MKGLTIPLVIAVSVALLGCGSQPTPQGNSTNVASTQNDFVTSNELREAAADYPQAPPQDSGRTAVIGHWSVMASDGIARDARLLTLDIQPNGATYILILGGNTPMFRGQLSATYDQGILRTGHYDGDATYIASEDAILFRGVRFQRGSQAEAVTNDVMVE